MMRATAALTETGMILGHQTDLHPGAEEVAVEAVGVAEAEVAVVAVEAPLRVLHSVEAVVVEDPEVVGVEEAVEEVGEEAVEEEAAEEEGSEVGGGRTSLMEFSLLE